LREAGYEVLPWKMAKAPNGFWKERANRKWAIDWLIEERGVNPEDITVEVLEENDLGSLYQRITKTEKEVIRKRIGKGRMTSEHYLAELLRETGYHKAAEKMAAMSELTMLYKRYNSKGKETYLEWRKKRIRDFDPVKKKMVEALSGLPDGDKVWTTPARAKALIGALERITGRSVKDFTYGELGKLGLWHELNKAHGFQRLIERAGMDIRPWELKHIGRNSWKDRETRADAFRWAMERCGKDAHEMTVRDLNSLGLSFLGKVGIRGLMADMGLESSMWRKKNKTDRWDLKEDRVAATRWLMDVTGKKGEDLTTRDFSENGLFSLWMKYTPAECRNISYEGRKDYGERYLMQFTSSEKRAAAEAGALDPDADAYARRRKAVRYGKKEVRAALVRGLLERSGKRPEELRYIDFQNAGILYLLAAHYDNDLRKALKEAGFNVDRMDVASRHPVGKWKAPEARIRVIRELLRRLGKPPNELTTTDIKEAGLAGLFNYGGLHDLLVEAGYNVHPWELGRVRDGLWASKENRSAAMRWLIERVDIAPYLLTSRDFQRGRLNGLWQHEVRRQRAAHGGKGRGPHWRILYSLLMDAGANKDAEKVLATRKDRMVDRKERRESAARIAAERAPRNIILRHRR